MDFYCVANCVVRFNIYKVFKHQYLQWFLYKFSKAIDKKSMKGEFSMDDDIQLFTVDEVLQYTYISVPKELFINPIYSHLSSDSKLLYGFILDRFSLSMKNNCQDENRLVYLIFTRKDIQKLFNLSDKTVTKAFKQLIDCKLIY